MDLEAMTNRALLATVGGIALAALGAVMLFSDTATDSLVTVPVGWGALGLGVLFLQAGIVGFVVGGWSGTPTAGDPPGPPASADVE